MTHVANKIATVTQPMIPIGVGVLGFMPGLVLGFYKDRDEIPSSVQQVFFSI